MSPGFYKHKDAKLKASRCSKGDGSLYFLSLPHPLQKQFNVSGLTKVTCSSLSGFSGRRSLSKGFLPNVGLYS